MPRIPQHKDALVATHWGTYRAEEIEGRPLVLRGFERDSDPSPIGLGLPEAACDASRIQQPMVRLGYLKHGASSKEGRGAEPFVPVSWDTALDLVSGTIMKVVAEFGNESIFGGSYGWASAGRFHHAQSQLRRFLNLCGGFVRSVNTYSYAAGEVILPHVTGDLRGLVSHHTSWPAIAQHTRLVVMFGGMPLKNAQVTAGGVGQHTTQEWLRACKAAGIGFVNISPAREGAADFLKAQWLAPRPNTDTAIMLALAHTLVNEGLHDSEFLDRYCVGFEQFLPYLNGTMDGRPKDADWAAQISGLAAEDIRGLARRMARQRTMITVSWSVQRADHGEQPYWMAITLAAILGQIGLPGGGFGFGYAGTNRIGNPVRSFPWPALPQGENPIENFIPVARISDLLLKSGQEFDYNGRRMRYPDTKLVYWVGGNPFHHHQNINRLIAAWRKPDTVIVHEIWWNALARHADIVLPITTALERNDIACAAGEAYLIAMRRVMEPFANARNDHDIFADLALRLGVHAAFTEGRGEAEWLRYLYDLARQRARDEAMDWPEFDKFWEYGFLELPPLAENQVLLADFRRDPEGQPLNTPSGRIEIHSSTIESYGYEDCPGHPTWLEPAEWLGSEIANEYPLHLVSSQPRTRLHGQLDNGPLSRNSKIAGREPISIHPCDAARRGISSGDLVRVFSKRGACLAGAVVTDGITSGVVELSTGAWYDPVEPGRIHSLDSHGCANVLTLDKGTSKLAQAPSSHTTLVQIERFDDAPPPVKAFAPPPMVESDAVNE